MRAGAMNTPVIVQVATTTKNTLSEPVKSWGKYCDAWAEVKALNASERLQGAVEEAKAVYKVKLRYGSDTIGITADMRIQSNNLTLYITSQPVQVFDALELLCEVRSIDRG